MKRKRTLKGNNKIAKRNNVKLTRKFNGQTYKLVDEVDPVSGSTPEMFMIRNQARNQRRSVRFVYNKTNETGLVYFSTKQKTKKKRGTKNGKKRSYKKYK